MCHHRKRQNARCVERILKLAERFADSNANNRAAKNTCLGHLKDQAGKYCATIIIPNGISRGDVNIAALSKAYLASPNFRGLDKQLI